MNKKGISDIFLVVLQLIIVAMVLAFMFTRSGEVDIEFLKRTLVVNNLGLLMTTISFVPGNFQYTYLSETDEKMKDWNEFPFQLTIDSIKYSETEENMISAPHSYPLHMNTLDYEILARILTMRKHEIFIQKTDTYNISDKIGQDLRKLKCNPLILNLPLRPLNGGEEGKFYDEEGREITTTVREDWQGMELQYFTGQQRVYPGNRGLKNDNNPDEVEATYKLAKLVNDKIQDIFIPQEKVENKTILLTVGEYNETQNFLIVYAPVENYEINYNIGCTIVNGALDTELSSQYDGVVVVPYEGKHILLEIGNIAKPNNPTLKSEDNLKLLAGVIRNG